MKIKIYFKDKDTVILNRIEKTYKSGDEYVFITKKGDEIRYKIKNIYRILKQYIWIHKIKYISLPIK